MIKAIAYLSHRQLVDKLNATSEDVLCLGSEKACMPPEDFANNLTFFSSRLPLGAWNNYMETLAKSAPPSYYYCFASLWIVAYYITLPTAVADAVIPPLEVLFLPNDVREFMDLRFIPEIKELTKDIYVGFDTALKM